MSRIVHAGHTLSAHGTLAAGNYLHALAATGPGQAGAVVQVLGSATNNGNAVFYGSGYFAGEGPGAAASGIVGAAGTLVNNGTITLRDAAGDGAGHYGHGSTLDIAGVLDTSGLILLQGYSGERGSGASLAVLGTGTLQNAGTIRLSGLAVDTAIAASVSTQTISDAGVLTNSGQLFVTGGFAYADYTGIGAAMSVTGVLTNSGIVFLTGGDNYSFNGAVASGATLSVQGASGSLLNQGRLYVEPGTGLFAAGSGALLSVAGSLVNGGTLSVSGSQGGYGPVSSSGTLLVSGQLTNDGFLRIGEGYAYANHTGGVGGVLNVSGALFNSGTLVGIGGYGGNSPGGGAQLGVGAGGYFQNTGSILLYGGFPGQTAGGGATLIVGGLLENMGYIGLGAGFNAAELIISSTGYLDDRYDIHGGGTILNENILQLSSDSPIYAGAVINDGLIDSGVYSNPVIVSPLLTGASGSGTVFIDGGSTLTLYGSVAAGQSVVLSNDYAPYGLFPSLALGDTAGFSGVLTDLFAGASIDFLGLDVASASASGTTLTLDLASGGSLALGLSAPLSTGLSFNLAPDSGTGTELTVVHGP